MLGVPTARRRDLRSSDGGSPRQERRKPELNIPALFRSLMPYVMRLAQPSDKNVSNRDLKESGKGGVITNLQALRAFAAFSVVFYHTAFVIPGAVHTDFFGVMIFFIISGFIMTYITRSSDKRFLANRVLRIVPLYWIATIFTFLFRGLELEDPTVTFPTWWHYLTTSPPELAVWLSNTASASCKGGVVIELVKSMLFIPTGRLPYLGVGWTLNIEMFFYVVFWGALKISRRFAPLIACAVLIVFKVTPLRELGAPGALYAHSYTVGFIIGVGLYYAWKVFELWEARVNRFIVCGAVGVSWTLFAHYSLKGSAYINIPYPYLTLPALIVFGALAMHSKGMRISWPWLILLGDASYALYLFHGDVMDMMRHASAAFPSLNTSSSVFALVVAIFASCLLAIAVYLTTECPLLRTLKRRAAAPPPTEPLSIGASVASLREGGRAPPNKTGKRWPDLLRENWAVVLILIVTLPSFIWMMKDHHVWTSDAASYGEASVELWFKFSHHFLEWFAAMATVFGSRAPGIAWLGQFFVPIGGAAGSIEAGLLCAILTAQIGSIALFYKAVREFAPGRRLVAVAGILLFAGAPLFVAMSHQYFPEPFQLFGVTYFFFLAVTGHKMRRIKLMGHLLLATAIALLANINAPVYCALPGLMATYGLMRRRNSEHEAAQKRALWEWVGLFGGMVLCVACATWYVRNLPALREALKLRTFLEFTTNYGRPTFHGKLSDWLSALQSSFELRWVIFGQVLLVGSGVALARILGEGGMKPRESGSGRLNLLTICSLIQILVVLALSSLNHNEDTRYFLPLLPAIATINIWFVCKIRQPRLLAGVIAILSCQWAVVYSHALGWGSLDSRSCSYWLIPFDKNREPENEMARLVRQTSNTEDRVRYNMVGVESPWLNANSLSFYAAKQELKTRGRCYYTSVGDGSRDLDLTWKRLSDLKVEYFISLEEEAQPEDWNSVDPISNQALRRIRKDPEFISVPFESGMGVVLFRRKAASPPTNTGAPAQ